MTELIKLEIEGFGKFDKNKTINFKKGVNFIYGLNEAGKSTILEAILASIFKYTNTKIKPFFCWTNNDVCKLTLTYKNDENEIFQVISDYKNAKKKLLKITESEISEISTTPNTIRKYLKDHFGFDEQKVFENTTFIRQSQMAILSDSTTKNKLRDMIEEVFVGSAEASATKALKKIKTVAKDSKKEVKTLNEDFNELKNEFEIAKENKISLTNDSSEYDEISKSLIENQTKFDELTTRKKRFDKKEKYTEEYQYRGNEIDNIDNVLLSVNGSIKKRNELIDKQEYYKGFDSISNEDFLIIKENIKKLEKIKTSLEIYEKSGGKKKVVQEKLDFKYVVLFVVGLLLSIILIGIPLTIYAYKRMKKEVTIEKDDTESQNEIKAFNDEKEKVEKEMGQLLENIKNYDTDTFVDLFGEYNGIISRVEMLTESIEESIKNILDQNAITDNENENIKKITEIKTKLLNDQTITKNNLDDYKLVNLTDKDLDEIKALEERVQKLNNRKVELHTIINKTKELVKSPEEIKEQVDAIDNKRNELIEKSEEHELAAIFLEKAETEVQHKFTPSIEKNSMSILKKVTDNKYSDLKINEDDLSVSVKAPEINEYVPVDILSQGTKDQIYFTIRTTMTDLLSGNVNLPLILDDPFHNFDDVRLRKTISAVKELANDKQIILISHKNYQKDYADFADNIIEV